MHNIFIIYIYTQHVPAYMHIICQFPVYTHYLSGGYPCRDCLTRTRSNKKRDFGWGGSKSLYIHIMFLSHAYVYTCGFPVGTFFCFLVKNIVFHRDCTFVAKRQFCKLSVASGRLPNRNGNFSRPNGNFSRPGGGRGSESLREVGPRLHASGSRSSAPPRATAP